MVETRKNRFLKDCINTVKDLVRCTCPNGHVFAGEIYAAVNRATDPEVIDDFASSELQNLECQSCAAVCGLAEPVLLHDPQNKKLSLFIPSVLAHKELELRADLAVELAGADLENIPFYFLDCRILLGRQDLATWLQGPDPAIEAQQKANQPRIHEAFQDLLTTKSAPPPRFVGADWDPDAKSGYDDEDVENPDDIYAELKFSPSREKKS